MLNKRDQLLEELKRLRRGTGLGGSLADVSPGAGLRTVVTASEQVSDASVARLLRTELARLIDRLPESMQQVAKVALNINIPELSDELLDNRISWLANETDRDTRTIRRRIDTAMKSLVDIIVAKHDWKDTKGRGDNNWSTTSCRAILRMDLPDGIEAVDEREVVIHGAPTNTISMPFTLPRHPDDPGDPHEIQMSVLFGGKFVTNERLSDLRYDVSIEFPKVVQPGERRRYALLYKIPPGQMMRPHYVFAPYFHCESFELVVRFDMNNLPYTIRKVEGAFNREIDELQPDKNIMEVDEAGEVRATFKNLRTGFGYGIQWRFKTSEES